MSSRIIIETIHSQYLKDNPLDDPATRQLPIYLPPGYDDNEKRYPVVYLLVGFTGNFLVKVKLCWPIARN